MSLKGKIHITIVKSVIVQGTKYYTIKGQGPQDEYRGNEEAKLDTKSHYNR